MKCIYVYLSLGNVFICTVHCIHAQVKALPSRNMYVRGKMYVCKVR